MVFGGGSVRAEFAATAFFEVAWHFCWPLRPIALVEFWAFASPYSNSENALIF